MPNFPLTANLAGGEEGICRPDSRGLMSVVSRGSRNKNLMNGFDALLTAREPEHKFGEVA
jgi:hypothetical protein